MWPTLIIAVLVVVAVWILSRGSIYKKIFAEAHLLEVGGKIASLKKAALETMITRDELHVQSHDDPRVFTTEPGLLLIYTISQHSPDEFVHHLSVSLAGQYTARAVGGTFVLLWAKLLGIDYAHLHLGVSQATVHHAEFVLREAEQIEFAHRAVLAPDQAWIEACQADWVKFGPRLQWEQIDVKPA